jgi:hypothetical protein
LAWTFWFLELYIKNQNTDNISELVDKAINKIIYTKYSFVQYIRSYAGKLSKAKENILLSLNFPCEFIYKSIKNNDEIKSIIDELSINI